MITKERLIESIQSMPEDKFEDIDVLIERIFFLEKLERGLKDIEDGNVVDHDDVKKIISTWSNK